MSRASIIQASVNAGELSPLMMGRVDQAVYSIAGERMENFVPLIQGPMLKRSGTRLVAEAKGPFRPIPFEFNTTQTYIIEAGQNYLRFFTNDAAILDGGVPYELATPYSYDEGLDLGIVQSGDVLYLVHGGHAPRTLTRTGATSFTLAEWEMKLGPFDDDNADESLTVAASASAGNITLYASADLFQEGHVGGLFKMEARDLAEIPTWEPEITVANGVLRQWSGKVYMKVGGTGRTGTVPPIHSEGVEWDGMGSGARIDSQPAGGVQWQYVHDRFGIVRITGFTSARKVSATVLKRLPFGTAAANTYKSSLNYTPPYTGSYSSGGFTFHSRFTIDEAGAEPVFTAAADDYAPEGGSSASGYTAPGTWRWAFGAFSSARGWPDAAFIWNERMILAKGNRLYGSVVGSYSDFRERNESGEISADMAFRFTLNSPNAIQWIMGDKELLVGTSAREHVAQAAGEGGVPGPGNFAAPSHTSYGSARIPPLFIGGRVLFVQKDRRKLREFDFQLARERFAAPDLTVLASHVSKPKFTWLAYQATPHSLVWAGLGDGSMAVMAYSPEQEVKGWCRVTLAPGSLARRGACILDPAGEQDQLWLHVERGGLHYVERLEAFRDPGDPVEDAFHVDGGLSYSGPPVSSVSGLEHYAGETVNVVADGRHIGALQVSAGGAVNLPDAASKIHAGKFFPARFKSLRVEANSQDGSAQGKLKRISHLALRLLETAGLRARVQDGEWEEVENRGVATAMGAPVPLFTGDHQLGTIGDYDRDGQCEVESFAPLPACVLALTPSIVVGKH